MKIILILIIAIFLSEQLSAETTPEMLRKNLPMGVPIKSNTPKTLPLNDNNMYIISGFNMTEFPCTLKINGNSLGIVNPYSYIATKYSTNQVPYQYTVQADIVDPIDPYINGDHIMIQSGKPTDLNKTHTFGAANPSYIYNDLVGFNDFFFDFTNAGTSIVKITILETRVDGTTDTTIFNASILGEKILRYFLDEGSSFTYQIDYISGAQVTCNVYTY